MIAYNLEQALPHPERIQELHLVGRGMRTLSTEITQCKHLRKLVLCRNQLAVLPDWLTELPFLESIDVSGNPLTNWPVHLGRQLTELLVEGTQLVLEPGTLLAFPRLRLFNGTGCSLEGEMRHLYLPSTLEKLVIRNLGARVLPTCLAGLGRLRILDASENQLSRLPTPLPSCLEILDLSKNRLQSGSLAAEFPKLEHLDLSRNRFEEVPSGVWEDNPSLQTLDLSDNRLKRLPVKPPSFTRLRTLDLSKNRLIDLPQELGQCHRVKTLNLQRNAFAKLPEVLFSWSRLDRLDLSRNKLEKLHGDWLQLTQLRGLILDKNPLIELPRALFRLNRLQTLSLKAIKVKPTAAQIFESPALDKVYPQRGFTSVLTFNRLLRKDKVPAAQRYNCWKLRTGDSPRYAWELVRIGLSSSDGLLRKKTSAWIREHADRVLLEPGVQLLPVGDSGFLREEWSNRLQTFIRVKKREKFMDAILLGQGRIDQDLLPKTATPICQPYEVQAWLDRHYKGADFSQDRMRKLEQLLCSRIAADVDLALGILRVHGLPNLLKPSFTLALDQHRGSSLGRRLRSFAQRYPDTLRN